MTQDHEWQLDPQYDDHIGPRFPAKLGHYMGGSVPSARYTATHPPSIPHSTIYPVSISVPITNNLIPTLVA